jgi:two-component system response regulator AgrA
MELIRVFIIEDLFTHRSLLKRAVKNIGLPNLSFEVLPIEDYIGFYEEIDHLSIRDTDIFIIDLDLKSFYNGIDYAKKIRKCNLYSGIIFLTADDQQGIHVINQRIQATSYLVKDVFDIATIEGTLSEAILSIRELHEKIYVEHNDQYLFVQTDGKYLKIRLSSVLYFETIKTMKGYLHLKTLSHDVIIRGTISEMRNKLENIHFFITNLRSLIINLHTVETINPSEGQIIFCNDEQLFVGRKVLKKVKVHIY